MCAAPCFRADLATPVKAGAKAACQKGRITTSARSANHWPAKAHVLGDRLSRRAAMSASFSVLLGSHCDVPGNNQLGYCRDQVTASTWCPSASRARDMAALNCAMRLGKEGRWKQCPVACCNLGQEQHPTNLSSLHECVFGRWRQDADRIFWWNHVARANRRHGGPCAVVVDAASTGAGSFRHWRCVDGMRQPSWRRQPECGADGQFVGRIAAGGAR